MGRSEWWSGWAHRPKLPLSVHGGATRTYHVVIDARGCPVAQGSEELCVDAIVRLTRSLLPKPLYGLGR